MFCPSKLATVIIRTSLEIVERCVIPRMICDLVVTRHILMFCAIDTGAIQVSTQYYVYLGDVLHCPISHLIGLPRSGAKQISNYNHNFYIGRLSLTIIKLLEEAEEQSSS